jgi:hypothetical protein
MKTVSKTILLCSLFAAQIAPAVLADSSQRTAVTQPTLSRKLDAMSLAVSEAFRMRDTLFHACTVPNGELYGHCEQSYYKEPCDRDGNLSNGWQCVRAWVPNAQGIKEVSWVYPMDADAYAVAVKAKDGSWSKEVMTAGGMTNTCVSRGDCEATIFSKRPDYKPCSTGADAHPSATGYEPRDQYCSRGWVRDATGAERLTFLFKADVPAHRRAYLAVNNEWK